MKNIVRIVITVAVIVVAVIIFCQVDETVPEFTGRFEYEAENYVYYYCHRMANNFIEAEDNQIRGYVRADKKNIARILDVLDKYSFQHEDNLRNWLRSFENGDYHDAVNFHNYCWKQLDGEVGWAVDLKNRYK